MTTTYLPMEQTVLVPSTRDGDKPISKKQLDKRVNEVRKFLSEKYGGYTSVRADGGYVIKKKKGEQVIEEPVVEVTAFSTKEDYEKNGQALYNKISYWRKKWGQDSMGYEVEGDLFYIGKSRKSRIPNQIKKVQKLKLKQNLPGADRKRKRKSSSSQMSWG